MNTIREAAIHARDRVWPGSPVGEIVYRELMSYADFGVAFDDGLSERLASHVLTLPTTLREAA